MQRASTYLIGALFFLTANSAAAALVPHCSSYSEYFLCWAEEFGDDLILVVGETHQQGITLLMSCQSEKQLEISAPGYPRPGNADFERLLASAASIHSPSLVDLSVHFNVGDVSAIITDTASELCACLTKDN